MSTEVKQDFLQRLAGKVPGLGIMFALLTGNHQQNTRVAANYVVNYVAGVCLATQSFATEMMPNVSRIVGLLYASVCQSVTFGLIAIYNSNCCWTRITLITIECRNKPVASERRILLVVDSMRVWLRGVHLDLLRAQLHELLRREHNRVLVADLCRKCRNLAWLCNRILILGSVSVFLVEREVQSVSKLRNRRRVHWPGARRSSEHHLRTLQRLVIFATRLHHRRWHVVRSRVVGKSKVWLWLANCDGNQVTAVVLALRKMRQTPVLVVIVWYSYVSIFLCLIFMAFSQWAFKVEVTERSRNGA